LGLGQIVIKLFTTVIYAKNNKGFNLKKGYPGSTKADGKKT
jgi:hypothetical protein